MPRPSSCCCIAAFAMLSGLACADPYDGGDPADDDDSMDDDSAADDDDLMDDDSAADDDDSAIGPLPFVPRLAAGYAHSCAVEDDGQVVCWGCQNSPEYDMGQCIPPAGVFSQVAAGGFHSCALGIDGSVTCWGEMDSGEATGQPGPLVQIAAGRADTCALDGDGQVTCWGCEVAGSGVCDPPLGQFVQIAAADEFACALGDDLHVVCWGTGGWALDGTPELLIHVATGSGVACGIKASNHMVICWDDAAFPPAPLGIMATQVSIGDYHACLIDVGGSPHCWYENPGSGLTNFGQADPPPDLFEQVASGAFHTCGRRLDGVISCWGDDRWGQAQPQ